jgi:hypothetical protein
VKQLTTLFLLALLAGPGAAWAFKINPCLRELTFEDGKLGQDAVRKNINICVNAPEKYREAVHEHMTVLAIAKYRGEPRWQPDSSSLQHYDYTDPVWWTAARTSQTHLTSALVYGTWWNDDPLMYTWGQGWDIIEGFQKLKKLSDPTIPTYPGGTRNCALAADMHLGWHSHYGRLQHLHFMTGMVESNSTADERVRSTTDKALKWIEFAYAVATKQLAADAPLLIDQQLSVELPAVAANHCVHGANVKIRTLFSRLGMQRTHRDAIAPDVALGTILHIIQDSFSPAHTCRVARPDGSESKALLEDVYNYNEQSKGNHSQNDLYPAWLHRYAATGIHTYSNDPIVVGAWLISAVDNRLRWEEVESHLKSTVFATSSGHASPARACIGVLR